MRHDGYEVSAGRQAFDRAFLGAVMRALLVLAQRWLLLLNTATAIFLGLALLTPVLFATGWDAAARALFESYHIACHQFPERSFFIAGHQVAICQRDVGTYGAILVGGLAFNGLRHRLRPLRWRYYVLFLIPMALDAGTQLLGWRESTWALRLLTGAIFGLGTVWLLFPFIEETMIMVRQDAAAWLARNREAHSIEGKGIG
jgi:uncharacterized membrane protein